MRVGINGETIKLKPVLQKGIVARVLLKGMRILVRSDVGTIKY